MGTAEPGGPQPVLHLGPDPADLDRLYPWLEAAAAARNLPQAVRFGMHVAAEEAVANAARHAFAPDAPGEIAVRLCDLPDAAALVVEDTGRPFDPVAAPARERPASLRDARPGGLGLTLLRHYCHDISYQRIDGRNHLTMRFPLPRR